MCDITNPPYLWAKPHHISVTAFISFYFIIDYEKKSAFTFVIWTFLSSAIRDNIKADENHFDMSMYEHACVHTLGIVIPLKAVA